MVSYGFALVVLSGGVMGFLKAGEEGCGVLYIYWLGCALNRVHSCVCGVM